MDLQKPCCNGRGAILKSGAYEGLPCLHRTQKDVLSPAKRHGGVLQHNVWQLVAVKIALSLSDALMLRYNCNGQVIYQVGYSSEVYYIKFSEFLHGFYTSLGSGDLVSPSHYDHWGATSPVQRLRSAGPANLKVLAHIVGERAYGLVSMCFSFVNTHTL